MEKIKRARSKWSYVKVAAWSGTLGLTVGIVYTVVNFIQFGNTQHPGGFIEGIIGQFYLLFLVLLLLVLYFLQSINLLKKYNG
jgi:hypothetical protein